MSARWPIAALVLGLSAPAHADVALAAAEAHCRTLDTTTLRRVETPVRPSYFFKAIPDTPLVALATSTGNVLLDLSGDRARALPIPGRYDPIPSAPDGRLVSVSDGRLRIYALAALQRDGAAAQPFFVSERTLMTGVYQSLARLGPPGAQATYRVTIVSNEDGRLRFQDLDVAFDGDEPLRATERSPPQRLCTNLDTDAVSLPMLSKDGREIALLVDRSTRVFRIEGTRCEQVLDLGIATGKVDFSFDGRRLAFHLGASERASTSDGGVPWREALLRPWIYDRDAAPGTSPFRFVRLEPLGNAYYPVFTPQGSLIYLHAVPRGDAVDYGFVHAALPVPASAAGPSVTALGRLWIERCTGDHEQARILAPEAVARSLDPAACRRLVDAFATAPDRDAAALRAACPAAATNPGRRASSRRQQPWH